jgi:hypothetical protein
VRSSGRASATATRVSPRRSKVAFRAASRRASRASLCTGTARRRRAGPVHREGAGRQGGWPASQRSQRPALRRSIVTVVTAGGVSAPTEK